MIWNQAHLQYALREFEQFYNEHRPRQNLTTTKPESVRATDLRTPPIRSRKSGGS